MRMKGTSVAWDTEGTQARILAAARDEFAAVGPDGTTIERIAKRSGVNKERIYNYFGGKRELFQRVLHDELAQVAEAVPFDPRAGHDIGDYAGRLYDYHQAHPPLIRLLHWEGLGTDGAIVDQERRTAHYARKREAIRAAQHGGVVSDAIDADHLTFLILAVVAWWSAVPQVSEMLTGPDGQTEQARRRGSVVEAVRRLASV